MVRGILTLYFVTAVFLSLQFADVTLAGAESDLATATSLFKNGRYAEAEQPLKDVVTQYPGTGQGLWAQRYLCRLYIETGNFTAAKTAVNKLLSDFSERTDLVNAVKHIANAYRGPEEYAKCKELYQTILTRWPGQADRIEVQYDLAVANINLGNYRGAEAAVDKILADFSSYENIAFYIKIIARHYLQSQQHAEIRKFHQKVLANLPQNEVAISSQTALAIANIMLGDYTAAQTAVDKLLLDFSGHNDIAYSASYVAYHYCQEQEYEKAEALYQTVLNNWPQSEQRIWAQMGKGVLVNIGRGNESAAQIAIDGLSTNFAGNSDLPTIMFAIGEVYYKKAILLKNQGQSEQGDIYLQKGITQCEKVINDLPSHKATVLSYVFVADSYHRLGQYAKAIEYYEHILDTWPGYTYAWNTQFLIGRSYEDMKKAGQLASKQADQEIRTAYQSVVDNYPNCKAVKAAQRWLGRN